MIAAGPFRSHGGPWERGVRSYSPPSNFTLQTSNLTSHRAPVQRTLPIQRKRPVIPLHRSLQCARRARNLHLPRRSLRTPPDYNSAKPLLSPTSTSDCASSSFILSSSASNASSFSTVRTFRSAPGVIVTVISIAPSSLFFHPSNFTPSNFKKPRTIFDASIMMSASRLGNSAIEPFSSFLC